MCESGGDIGEQCRINRYIVGCKSFHPTQKPVKLYEELIDT